MEIDLGLILKVFQPHRCLTLVQPSTRNRIGAAPVDFSALQMLEVSPIESTYAFTSTLQQTTQDYENDMGLMKFPRRPAISGCYDKGKVPSRLCA